MVQSVQCGAHSVCTGVFVCMKDSYCELAEEVDCCREETDAETDTVRADALKHSVKCTVAQKRQTQQLLSNFFFFLLWSHSGL